MRIGIDCRLINASGIGRYTRNLLEQLQKIDRQSQYFIFLRRPDYDSLEYRSNFRKVLADFPWYGWEEQRKFPPLLKKYNLDLLHVPHFNIPFLYCGRFVVTIHDLIHLDFKMIRASTRGRLVYEIKHLVYKQVMNRAVRNSKKIITPSAFVKEAIMRRWGVDGAKIVVTPEAVEDRIYTIANKMSERDFKKTLGKFGITKPFIFYVGNAHPHKNVEGLIQAYLRLRKRGESLQLVLAGPDHYFWQKMMGQVSDKGVIYAGFVTEEELVALYSQAQVFVFPSLSEGFGIPMLEAMACGCPVAASDRAALPEVGSDAALYFDPVSPVDMAEKVRRLLNDKKFRAGLIKKGKYRVSEFSWERLAARTLQVYQDEGSNRS